MKIQIEKTTATNELQNNVIIERVTKKLQGLTRIEEAYNEVQNVVNPIMIFECGKGANHIWVSNYKGERLMLILETRYNN